MRHPAGNFGKDRHPLCPECKYDLVATVAAGRNICPECGYEFEPWELRTEKRPGEWTIETGLRHALQFLLLRSLALLVLWVGYFWLLMPLVSMFTVHFRVFGSLAGLTILFALPGLVIGHLLSKGLSDRAGFQSMLLGVLAMLFALAVIVGGVMLAQLLRPLPGWQGSFAAIATSLFATGWILRVTLLDD